MKKPIKRSKLRVFVGRVIYTLKKQIYWHFSSTDFAKKLEDKELENEIFCHQTIILRKLDGVDMELQKNKMTNLEIAIKNINGLILNPGQTFSYWERIGKPSKRKGYLEGVVLWSGKVKSDIGGGLCQLSNLIFWMTLHTPLTITERWRHSYDVFPDSKRTQPFGSGATCGYPNIDLQIENEADQKFQLVLKIENGFLVGKWLSDKALDFEYKVVEKDHEIKKEWWGGYSRNNKIFRKIIDKKTHQVVGEEQITENHAIMMYEPLLKNTNQSTQKP